MKTKRLSLLEYARRRGVSEQRVRTLVNCKKLSAKKTKHRLTVDPDEADKEWSNNVDDKFRPKVLDGDDEPTEAEIAAGVDEEITDENAGKTRRIAEARKEIWKARREQLDYEEKAGQLVAVDKVKRDAFESARIVRDSILAIPDKVSGLLIGLKDQATAHGILTKELNIAMSELAHAVEKINISEGVYSGPDTGPAANGQ